MAIPANNNPIPGTKKQNRCLQATKTITEQTATVTMKTSKRRRCLLLFAKLFRMLIISPNLYAVIYRLPVL